MEFKYDDQIEMILKYLYHVSPTVRNEVEKCISNTTVMDKMNRIELLQQTLSDEDREKYKIMIKESHEFKRKSWERD